MPRVTPMKLSDLTTETEFDAAFLDPSWDAVAQAICASHGFETLSRLRAAGSEHVVFFVGDSLILKIYNPFGDGFEREQRALTIVGGKISLATPEIVAAGSFEGIDYLLITRVGGLSLTRAKWLGFDNRTQEKFVSKLAAALCDIRRLPSAGFDGDWPAFVADRAATFVERQIAAGVNPDIIDALPRYFEENLALVPTCGRTVFMHADVHFGNLTVRNRGGELEPFGLFDFADSRRGHFEYEFLAVGVLMIQGQREVQREFFRAYGYSDADLDEEMRRRLMMLTMLYETADLRRYALRLRPEATEYSLERLEREIWSFV